MSEEAQELPVKRKRGRPPGSKNKSKTEEVKSEEPVKIAKKTTEDEQPVKAATPVVKEKAKGATPALAVRVVVPSGTSDNTELATDEAE